MRTFLTPLNSPVLEYTCSECGAQTITTRLPYSPLLCGPCTQRTDRTANADATNPEAFITYTRVDLYGHTPRNWYGTVYDGAQDHRLITTGMNL